MAKGKPTPDRSKIARDRPLAYSRRQKGSGGLGGSADNDKDVVDDDDKAAKEPTESAPDAPPQAEPAAAAAPDAAPETVAGEPPAVEPPPSKGEPWPDATPQPMRPVEPAPNRSETVAMPAELAIGLPPTMPTTNPFAVEDPTVMPGPRDVPAGNPDDLASPPGLVPSGDSRSLRKDTEFALVYRVQTAVITRSGVVGTRGQWRVVNYPTSSSASNAYAKEVSRFVAEGFSDYRE